MNEAKEPEYVYVAIYTHRSGEDVRVFRTEEGAWKWAESIARDKWSEWHDIPMPTENIAKTYFNRMNIYYDGEVFEVGRCVIREDEA